MKVILYLIYIISIMLTVTSKLRFLPGVPIATIIMDMYGYNAQKWDKI